MDQSELDLEKAKLDLSKFNSRRNLIEQASGQKFYPLEWTLFLVTVVLIAITGANEIRFGKAPSVFVIVIMVIGLIMPFNIRNQRRLDALLKLIANQKDER